MAKKSKFFARKSKSGPFEGKTILGANTGEPISLQEIIDFLKSENISPDYVIVHGVFSAHTTF